MTRLALLAAFAARWGCRERFPAGATYTAATGEQRHVTRDASGTEDVTRTIGTLTNGVAEVEVWASNGGTVWLAIDRADTVMMSAMGVMSARQLRLWLPNAERWVSQPGAPQPGASVTEELKLDPITLEETGDGFY